MKWTPTPLKGVYTGSRKGTSYMLISFESPTKPLRGRKKLSAQID